MYFDSVPLISVEMGHPIKQSHVPSMHACGNWTD